MNYYIIKVSAEYHKVCTELETKRLIKNDKCVPILIKYAPEMVNPGLITI